jgi:hypothetical protein
MCYLHAASLAEVFEHGACFHHVLAHIVAE